MTSSSIGSFSHDHDEGTNNNLVIVIAGPTGVGKSDVAAALCHNRGGMIVSADSVQAYQGVQIGANKPTHIEMEDVPHFLVDAVDSDCREYNVAEWRRDALAVLSALSTCNREETNAAIQNKEESKEAKARRCNIIKGVENVRLNRGIKEEPILPVVVGGTMMYLQWLVYGEPDAARPTPEAVKKANTIISKYKCENDWSGATSHVESMGPAFALRVTKLSHGDWYRLQRTLEIAFTVLGEQIDGDKNGHTNPTVNLTERLYSGEREGGLELFGYDVRCFFLCPDDRMNHTELIDRRCEEMLVRGLLKETTDLKLSNQLPDMATKAIGYRQTLDYLERESFVENDNDAFTAYLNDFTTATRRYAVQQMKWFRKDSKFVFVPVSLLHPKLKRVQDTASAIDTLCNMPRVNYEKELASLWEVGDGEVLPLSARTKISNEKQGKKMKFYQFQRHILKPGSAELEKVLKEADECTLRIRNKKIKSQIH